MKFIQPMFVDQVYLAKIDVIEMKEKGRAILKTEIYDKKENLTITGEAQVMHEMFKNGK